MTRWQPASDAVAAGTRATLLRRIRRYFETAGVLEVDTPALSPYAASDPQLESFEIAQSKVSPSRLFLNTSPEFSMKRLLAAGYPDIFSVCRVFRDGESGQRHQPEFTMIEWYRLGFDLREIIEDTIAVIDTVLTNERCAAEPVIVDYRDAFLQTISIDPLTASAEKLADATSADSDLRAAVGDHRDDWLDLLLLTHIVPTFANDRLTVLRHYPASQAALARLCPHDSDVADRFEIFFGATELANGYVELVDAAEQSRRIDIDNAERQRRNRPVRPKDVKLLAALASGLPHCAGVAMGFERLHMVHDNTDDIRDVMTFVFEAQE